jgi:hypothetical protein
LTPEPSNNPEKTRPFLPHRPVFKETPVGDIYTSTRPKFKETFFCAKTLPEEKNILLYFDQDVQSTGKC